MTMRPKKLIRALGTLAAAAALLTAGLYCARASAGAHDAVSLPAPAVDLPRAAKPGKSTVVFAGGCFWGVQAVFQHVKGVIDATSGYAGGSADTAKYELVSDGRHRPRRVGARHLRSRRRCRSASC